MPKYPLYCPGRQGSAKNISQQKGSAAEKDWEPLIHGVESSAHIKWSKKCYLGPVHGAIYVRQEAEKEGLSSVTLTELGLTWKKEIIRVQIAKQFFNNFRKESNISYRSR